MALPTCPANPGIGQPPASDPFATERDQRSDVAPWPTGYNLLAIPIGAGVFAFAGLNLPPATAAVATSASTIIVAADAQLLRRLDPAPPPSGDRDWEYAMRLTRENDA